MTVHADAFFAFARERHSIYLRRQAGQARPWTTDPILQKYSFTNVFRELDRTTVWWRAVSDTMRDKPEVLLATVLFRWFNRISTGEAIFNPDPLVQQTSMHSTYPTPWRHYWKTGETFDLRNSIVAHNPRGPFVTGSYIILGQQGMSKLDGVLACLHDFYVGVYEWDDQQPESSTVALSTYSSWKEVADFLLVNRGEVSLEQVWRWLRRVPYLGDFMAYEVVTDLRHTALLDRAPDIMTWANPGPGAARGLARVYGREISGRKIQRPSKGQLVQEMRDLLALSQSSEYWPRWQKNKYNVVGYHDDVVGLQQRDAWPALEMRDIEHTLCEFDKYRRAQTGEGRPRGTYKGS